MKDYVSYHPPAQSKKSNESKTDIPVLNYRMLMVIIFAVAGMVFLSYKGYRALTQTEVGIEVPEVLSITGPQQKQSNTPEVIAKFDQNDSDWWYEKLLTEPVQLDSNEQQAVTASSNIPSKLRCGTFNTVERAQRLQQHINSLDLDKQALITQTNNKFVVWIPNLASKRLAEKLRHKVLDANIGRCVIYDA